MRGPSRYTGRHSKSGASPITSSARCCSSSAGSKTTSIAQRLPGSTVVPVHESSNTENAPAPRIGAMLTDVIVIVAEERTSIVLTRAKPGSTSSKTIAGRELGEGANRLVPNRTTLLATACSVTVGVGVSIGLGLDVPWAPSVGVGEADCGVAVV